MYFERGKIHGLALLMRLFYALALCLILLPANALAQKIELRTAPEQRPDGLYLTRSIVSSGSSDNAVNQQLGREEIEGQYIVIYQSPPLLAVKNSLKRSAGNRLGANGVAALDAAASALSKEHSKFLSDLVEISAKTGSSASPKSAAAAAKRFVSARFRWAINGAALKGLSRDQIEGLRRKGYRVEPDVVVKASLTESVPKIAADQVWQLHDRAGRSITGRGIRVGVVDTGIDWTHAAFGSCTNEMYDSGACVKVQPGKNFINSLARPWDDHYHGTHVAATIGGSGTILGVAPDVTLYPVKVLNSAGSGSWSGVIGGIDWAADPDDNPATDDKMDVINLSLGGGGNPDDPVSLAIDNVVAAGVVAVISAGNSGPGSQTIGSPGCARQAITVGASSISDAIAGFSSRGPVVWSGGQLAKPDVVAPGVSICAARSANVSPSYECAPGRISLNGTSMAAPHVAGVAALLLQAYPSLTPAEVKQILMNSAEPLPGYSVYDQGSGRVNAIRALALAGDSMVAEIIVNEDPVQQRFTISGSADGDSFEHYVLQMRLKGSSTWTIIAEDSSPVVNGVFTVVDGAAMPGGDYELSLYVTGANLPASAFGAFSVRHAMIEDPPDLNTSASSEAAVLHSISDPISVTGSVRGAGFTSYELSFCTTDYARRPTSSCSTAGVSLAGDPTRPRFQESLGVIDFRVDPGVRSGFYAIKLDVHYSGRTESFYSTLYIDEALLSQYPRPFFAGPNGGMAYAMFDQPVLADVTGDRKKELIYSYLDRIEVLDQQGNSLPGFPFRFAADEYSQTPVSVGDLDGDGGMEVLGSTTSLEFHALKPNGSLARSGPWYMQSYIDSGRPIALLDLTGDGKPELLDPNLYVQDMYQHIPPSWNYFNTPTAPSRYASNWAYALGASKGSTNDRMRVFAISAGTDSKKVYAFGNDGRLLWSRDVGGDPANSIVSSPTVVDLNGDGKMDVTFLQVTNPRATFSMTLHALLDDGSIAPGFPQTRTTCNYSGCANFGWSYDPPPPAVADIDMDGSPEIVYTGVPDSSYYLPSRCIEVYRSNGELQKSICDSRWNFYTAVQIANVDEDPELEIIPAVSSATGECIGPNCAHTIMELPAFNMDGSFASGFPKVLFAIPLSDSVPVADIDDDGLNEMVFNTWDGLIYGWKLNACASESEEWGQMNGGPEQRREYKPDSHGYCSISQPVTVSGTVRDRFGRVLAGATVTISLACGTFTATTDANGFFSFNLECSGGYTITISTPTMEFVRRGVLTENAAWNLTLQLRRFLLSASVKNRRMVSVPQAPITVYLNGSPLPYDAISGRYQAELEYGSHYTISAQSDDGVGFFHGSVSGTIYGEVEHLLVRDSWEES